MAVWRLFDGAELHWRDWEDGSVVMDTSSGNSHFLDIAAAVTLRCIEETSSDEGGIVRRLADRLGDDSSVKLSEYIDRILPDLERLELIERHESIEDR